MDAAFGGMMMPSHHLQGRGATGPQSERDQFQQMLKNLIDSKESKKISQIPPSVFDSSAFRPIAPAVEKSKDKQ
jgi:hypothetical protein